MANKAMFLVAIVSMEDGSMVPLSVVGTVEEGESVCADTQGARTAGELTVLFPVTVLHEVPY